MGKDKKTSSRPKKFSPLDKRPPAPVPQGAFGSFIAKKQEASDKRTAKYMSQTKNAQENGVRNVTKIASVLQNKAFMKRENRYKKLFKMDEEEEQEANLLETTHIARDDEFADEGDKFIEFVAQDVQTGQVHPRVLQQLNDDPAGLARDEEYDENGQIKKKSKREVFKEMIRKSKYEKMVRQKERAEQSDKVQQLDSMFSSLFPELNISGLDKKKSGGLKDYDKLRAQLQFEPSLAPLHLAKEKPDGEQKKTDKRKKVDADQLKSDSGEEAEESSDSDEDGEEEDEDEVEADEENGEEEEYESYEESGDDVERIKEGELKVRKFNLGSKTKKDKIEENYNKAMKNLKLLGDLEDEILGKYMKDIDDIEGEDEEEDEEEPGDDEMGDEEDGLEEDGDEEEGFEEGEEEEDEN